MVLCSYGNEIAVTSLTEYMRLHDLSSFVSGSGQELKWIQLPYRIEYLDIVSGAY